MNLRAARRAGGFGGMLRKGDVTECIISTEPYASRNASNTVLRQKGVEHMRQGIHVLLARRLHA